LLIRISLAKREKGTGMLRRIATAAMLVLAVPTLVMAQGHEEYHPGGKPPPRGPHPGGPPGHIGGPPGHIGGPPGHIGGPPGHIGGPPGHFVFRGRPWHPVHIAPFIYPHGWAYRQWVIGATLPVLFLAPAYYYAGWAELGLPPPDPGFQWVRYGPDLLLVNVATGEVVDTAYGAFY
jgi:Nickel/cobalt transporter regulator